jgi:hypothetical protein
MTANENGLPDGAALRAVVDRTDPLGTLSVYATADPHESATARPAWQVRVINDLLALEQRLRKVDDPRADLVALRLDEVERELAEMLDTAGPGRGRALFLPLSGGRTRRVTVQVPLAEFVGLDPVPYVRPLVAAMSAHPPAGVAVVCGHGVRLVDVRLGRAVDADERSYEVADTDRHGHTGAGSGGSPLAQHGSAWHDVQARRAAERLGHFLRGSASWIAAGTRDRGWEYLAVAGDPEKTAPVVDALAADLPVVRETVRHRLAGLPAARVHAAVADDLDRMRHRVHRALCERTRDAALGGGSGSYGLADTLTTLAEGRVGHLLLDASREWTGRSGPDGRLHPEGISVPGVAEADLRPEPHLGERMIETALRQGASVTLVEPADADALAAGDGVAAMLRW